MSDTINTYLEKSSKADRLRTELNELCLKIEASNKALLNLAFMSAIIATYLTIYFNSLVTVDAFKESYLALSEELSQNTLDGIYAGYEHYVDSILVQLNKYYMIYGKTDFPLSSVAIDYAETIAKGIAFSLFFLLLFTTLKLVLILKIKKLNLGHYKVETSGSGNIEDYKVVNEPSNLETSSLDWGTFIFVIQIAMFSVMNSGVLGSVVRHHSYELTQNYLLVCVAINLVISCFYLRTYLKNKGKYQYQKAKSLKTTCDKLNSEIDTLINRLSESKDELLTLNSKLSENDEHNNKFIRLVLAMAIESKVVNPKAFSERTKNQAVIERCF